MLGSYVIWETFVVTFISQLKGPDGSNLFDSGTLMMLSEVLKLLICVGRVQSTGVDPWKEIIWADSWRYAVPGFLYCINNNLLFTVLVLIPPAVYQQLINLRTVECGIMYHLQGRPLSRRQWWGILAITAGSILCQMKSLELSAEMAFSILGVTLCIVSTWISTIAGVINENLLKSDVNFYIANIQLYSYGIVFNLLFQFFRAQLHSREGNMWRGWDHFSTYVMCLVMAMTGLWTAAVMKQYDNIVKIICIALSNFLTFTVGVCYFGNQEFSVPFCIGALLTCSGACLYNSKSAEDKDASTNRPSEEKMPLTDSLVEKGALSL